MTNRLRQDLRWITREGGTCCVMQGAAQETMPAFVLAVSQSALASGQISTVPMFLGALLQNLAPSALRWVGSVRLWSVTMVILQGLCLVALALGAALQVLPLWATFTLASLYWAAGWSVGPAWNTWMDSVVPVSLRASFFSRRNAQCAFIQWATMMGASWVLTLGERASLNLSILFCGLFGVAGLARLSGAYCMARQSEPLPLPTNYRVLGFRESYQKIRDNPKAKPLIYVLGAQLSLQLGAPFLFAFLVQQKLLGYGAAMLCMSVVTLSKVLVLPRLGRIAQQLGPHRLYQTSGLGLAAISLLWLLPGSHLAYCLALQAATGACLAAFEMANTLVYLEAIPASERTSVLTRFAIFNTMAGMLGSSLGATLLWFAPNYVLLFALAAAARLAALKLLTPATRPQARPTMRQRHRHLPERLGSRPRVSYRARRRSLRLTPKAPIPR
jgi:hypothetical protein